MPTVLQTTLLRLVIVVLSGVSTLYAIWHLLRLWWRNRTTFFHTKKHPRPAVLDLPEWKHRMVKLSVRFFFLLNTKLIVLCINCFFYQKVQLHLVECGDADSSRPLMLFLHGFPGIAGENGTDYQQKILEYCFFSFRILVFLALSASTFFKKFSVCFLFAILKRKYV